MTSIERLSRDEIVTLCASRFIRGFSVGTAGNVSV